MDVDIKDEINEITESVKTLADGKWEPKKDISAIATILFSLGGLVTGGLALLMQLGLLG